MELDIKDVTIRRVNIKVKGMKGINLTGVRLVHTPTGLYSFCACNDNYSQNFDTAWDCLYNQLRVVKRLRDKVSEPKPVKITLEADREEEGDSQPTHS